MRYTREKIAELLDVSVSYLAEVERGRAGISVKMLIKICTVLGLSADYLLFGKERGSDQLFLTKIHRIDQKYLPLIEDMLSNLLALSSKQE